MAIGFLCRGHRFALAYPNAVDYVALGVYHVVVTALGTGISAIKSHRCTSYKEVCAEKFKLFKQVGESFGI